MASKRLTPKSAYGSRAFFEKVRLPFFRARSEAKRILEQAQADADSLKAQTRQECSAMVEQAEQEVQQRWQTFDRKANALLDQYRSADSQPSEET